MPTIVCCKCSRVFQINGPPPKSCPACGCTLDNAADVTRTLDSHPELPETVVSSTNVPLPGFGRYQVQRKLGSGGFGVVYLAYDPDLQRLVAIKIAETGTGHSPAKAERFAREGRTAAQLRHPGIVSIYNVEEDQGRVFIVSEYVEGEPLAFQFQKGKVSFRNSASLIAAVASAVEHAHSKGIIHRDIKPGNIMVDLAGNPRLMDFGLAKRTEFDPTVTLPEQVLGTPAYMSPEQARGRADQVDRRTDIYGLGATFYHLLTNELPFHGDSMRVRDMVLSKEPKRPRLIDKDIPVDLETICLKAMEKDPAKRCRTARELAEDLERWLRGEPILARHITPFERSMRWCRRNPAPAGTIASVALLLLVVAVGSSLMAAVASDGRRKEAEGRQQAEKAKKVEANARVAAEESRNTLAAALAKNQELLSRAYVEKGSQYLRASRSADANSPIQALPWLAEAMKLDAKNENRLAADRIRLRTQLDFAPRIERMWFVKGGAYAAGFAPTRDKFFVAAEDGTLSVWRVAEDGPPNLKLPHPAKVEVGAFSPDGKLLATGSEDGVRIWETDSGRLLKGPLVRHVPSVPHAMPVTAQHPALIAFSQSGDLMLTASTGGINQVWDVRTGESIGAPILTKPTVTMAQFADSDRLVVVYGGIDRTLRVHDARSGAEKYVLHEKGENYTAACVNPAGTRIATGSSSGNVALWDAATGKKVSRLTVPGSGATIGAANFNSDGNLLATGSTDGTVRMWGTSEGRLLWAQSVLSGGMRQLEFSPDGSMLGVANFSGRFCAIAVQTAQIIAEPINNSSTLKSVDWTDSSGHLLTVDADGVVRLWSLQGVVPSFTLPHAHEIRAAVSADRSVLATADSARTVCLTRLRADARLDGSNLKLIDVGDVNIDAIALSDDGSLLAVSAERQIFIWDTLTQKRLVGPMLHTQAVARMRFSPNAAFLVCLSKDDRAAVWDVAAGRRLYEPLDVSRYPSDIDFDRDGRRCAVASLRGVTIWDLATGGRVGPGFLRIGSARFARFLNEPNCLLVGRFVGPTKVWDIASGQVLRTLAKRPDLACIAFSDDKSRFLTGYRDGTARLWFARDAAPASPAFEYPSGVSAGILDPSGRWLVTLTEDRHVLLWDAQTAELLSAIPVQYLRPTLPERARQSDGQIPLVFFSPESAFVYLVTSGGLIVSIGLDVKTHSLKHITEEIALRSGTEFDGAGGLKILEPDELAARWRTIGRTDAKAAVNPRQASRQ